MRFIAMGGEALSEGFALLGFETHANAAVEDVERVLAELLRLKERALVFLEHDLARGSGPSLNRVRKEGGRIVVAEVPALGAPADYHPPVEDLVLRTLGPSALDPRP